MGHSTVSSLVLRGAALITLNNTPTKNSRQKRVALGGKVSLSRFRAVFIKRQSEMDEDEIDMCGAASRSSAFKGLAGNELTRTYTGGALPKDMQQLCNSNQ